MEKLFFSLLLLCASVVAANAQLASAQFREDATVSNPLTIAFMGNSDPRPSCRVNLSTGLYGMSSSFSTVNAPTATWPLPTIGTQFSAVNIDVVISGVHYGSNFNLCTSAPGTYTIPFVGTTWTCTLNFSTSGSAYVLDFYP